MSATPAPLQLTGPERALVVRNLMARALHDAGDAGRDEVAVATAFTMLICEIERITPGSAIRARIIGTLESA